MNRKQGGGCVRESGYGLELLEPRMLLTAWPWEVDPSIGGPGNLSDPCAMQVVTTEALTRLDRLSIVRDQVAALKQSDPNADASVLSTQDIRVNAAGQIQAYVNAAAIDQDLLSSLDGAGVSVDFALDTQSVVQGWIPYDQFETVESLGAVSSISLPGYACYNQMGDFGSAGDAILHADDLRTTFGADGTGVKIGVFSQGIQHWTVSRDSGDLPTVHVQDAQDLGTGDEGTAMMEIIHDMAPGAELYFVPVETEADMMVGFEWLYDQGCRVIVDDVAFETAPYFSDGWVASMVRDYTEYYGFALTSWITAAGNFAMSHYQDAVNLNNSNYQTFDSGINPVDQYGTVYGIIPITYYGDSEATTTLSVGVQWTDDWGESSNDYSLITWVLTQNGWYPLDLVDDPQTGTGCDPLEYYRFFDNDLHANLTVGISIHRDSPLAATNRELELYAFESGELAAPADRDANDSIFGHAAVEGAIVVGAVNASDSGHDTVESFSSRGPATILADADMQTFTQRQVLDVVGIDGIATYIGSQDYFPPVFRGTSAAAPGVAAIVALIRSVPLWGWSPDGISEALHLTAVDLYSQGYDVISGYGRVDALAAVPPAPTAVDLAASSDTGISSTDNLTNLNNSPGKRLTFVVHGTTPGLVVWLMYYYAPLDCYYQLGYTTATATTTTITTDSLEVLADGPQIILAFQDSGPLESAPSPALTITVDTAGPTMTPIVNDGTGYDSQIDWLRFTFSEAVNSSTCAISLYSYVDSAWSDYISSGSTFFYDSGLHQAQWDMYDYSTSKNVIHDDARWYVAVVSAEDLAGNSLTGDNHAEFLRLGGDFNSDQKVSFADYLILESNFGKSVDYFGPGDANLNQQVSFADYLTLEANFGKDLSSMPEWTL